MLKDRHQQAWKSKPALTGVRQGTCNRVKTFDSVSLQLSVCRTIHVQGQASTSVEIKNQHSLWSDRELATECKHSNGDTPSGEEVICVQLQLPSTNSTSDTCHVCAQITNTDVDMHLSKQKGKPMTTTKPRIAIAVNHGGHESKTLPWGCHGNGTSLVSQGHPRTVMPLSCSGPQAGK